MPLIYPDITIHVFDIEIRQIQGGIVDDFFEQMSMPHPEDTDTMDDMEEVEEIFRSKTAENLITAALDQNACRYRFSRNVLPVENPLDPKTMRNIDHQNEYSEVSAISALYNVLARQTEAVRPRQDVVTFVMMQGSINDRPVSIDTFSDTKQGILFVSPDLHRSEKEFFVKADDLPITRRLEVLAGVDGQEGPESDF